MFIAHFGVGFAAKRAAPQLSLGTLVLAAQFIDLLWPTLLLIGWERVRIEPGATATVPLVFEHYPISHGLASVLGWAVLLGAAVWAARRDLRAAAVAAALVPSHWLLDALVHAPDLPLAPWADARIGLGWWDRPALAAALELLVFGLGVWLYLRATAARDRTGTLALGSLVVALSLIQVANLAGGPPPSVAAVAWVGQAQWLLVAWAYWVDRHRVASAPIEQRADGRRGHV